MANTTRSSQSSSRAGSGAISLIFFTLVWSGFLLLMWRAQAFERGPLWIWLFPLFGLLLACIAVIQLRERLYGGRVRLKLSQDPVPHGVPIKADFTLDKPLTAQHWQVEITLYANAKNSSNSTLLWSQDFAAHSTMPNRVSAQVMLPAEQPSTQASQERLYYAITMTLRGAGTSWTFNLVTRAATVAERGFAASSGS